MSRKEQLLTAERKIFAGLFAEGLLDILGYTPEQKGQIDPILQLLQDGVMQENKNPDSLHIKTGQDAAIWINPASRITCQLRIYPGEGLLTAHGVFGESGHRRTHEVVNVALIKNAAAQMRTREGVFDALYPYINRSTRVDTSNSLFVGNGLNYQISFDGPDIFVRMDDRDVPRAIEPWRVVKEVSTNKGNLLVVGRVPNVPRERLESMIDYGLPTLVS